jgi:hypothetical protein
VTCCRSGSCEQMFGSRFARRSLKRYRRNGLDDIERALVASVVQGIEGSSVLEIGGGVGAVQAELLAAGAERGEVVELVAAYEPYARELAEERGFAKRTRFRVVDLLEEPAGVDPADVVVLNRVVCCTPDGVRLTAVAAQLARHALLLSYPRDVWWTRAGARLQNAAFWLLRRSFRVFVHRPAELTAAAARAGLETERSGASAIWEYAVLRRAA